MGGWGLKRGQEPLLGGVWQVRGGGWVKGSWCVCVSVSVSVSMFVCVRTCMHVCNPGVTLQHDVQGEQVELQRLEADLEVPDILLFRLRGAGAAVQRLEE